MSIEAGNNQDYGKELGSLGNDQPDSFLDKILKALEHLTRQGASQSTLDRYTESLYDQAPFETGQAHDAAEEVETFLVAYTPESKETPAVRAQKTQSTFESFLTDSELTDAQRREGLEAIRDYDGSLKAFKSISLVSSFLYDHRDMDPSGKGFWRKTLLEPLKAVAVAQLSEKTEAPPVKSEPEILPTPKPDRESDPVVKAPEVAPVGFVVKPEYTQDFYEKNGQLPKWYDLDFRLGLFENAFSEFLASQSMTPAEIKQNLDLLAPDSRVRKWNLTKSNLPQQVPIAKAFMDACPDMRSTGFRSRYVGLMPIMMKALRAKQSNLTGAPTGGPKVRPNPTIDYSRKSPDQLDALVKSRVDAFLGLDDDIRSTPDRREAERKRADMGALMTAEEFQDLAAIHVNGDESSERVKPLSVGEIPTSYLTSVHNALSNLPSNVYSYMIQTHCRIDYGSNRNDSADDTYTFYFPLTKPIAECKRVTVRRSEINTRGFMTKLEDNPRYRNRVTGPTEVKDYYTVSNHTDGRLLIPKALEVAYMKAYMPGFEEDNNPRINRTGSVDWTSAQGGEPRQAMEDLLGREHASFTSFYTDRYGRNKPRDVENFFLNNYDPDHHIATAFLGLYKPGQGGRSLGDVHGEYHSIGGRTALTITSVDKRAGTITFEGAHTGSEKSPTSGRWRSTGVKHDAITMDLKVFSEMFQVVDVATLNQQKILESMDRMKK